MLLTPEELQKLTNRQRKNAQAKELRAMGIEFRTRTDGSLVVLRATVEIALGAGGTAAPKQERHPQLILEPIERKPRERRPK